MTDLKSILSAAAQRWRAPGAALSICRDGKSETVTTGVLNVETGEPVREESLFQIGSITKVVTAAMILQLQENSKVDLDAPVQRYVPDFRLLDTDAAANVTVRQLLNHTSGIAGDFFTDTGIGADRLARYIDRCALLPLAHPVGAGFSYSNAGFNIAGRIIENLTGLEFDAALDAIIFSPLKLRNSFARPNEIVGRSAASGHRIDPGSSGGWSRLHTNFVLPASGAPAGATIMMSCADLITMGKAISGIGDSSYQGEILSPASIDLMCAPSIDVPSTPRDISAVGLGWWIFRDEKGNELIGHDGSTIGQSAFLRIHPPSRTAVALFVNGGSANDLMMEVFSKTVDKIAGFTPSPPPREARSNATQLDNYVGGYETVGGRTEIFQSGQKLMRKSEMRIDKLVLPEPPVELKYVGSDLFIHTNPFAKYPVTTQFLQPDYSGRFSALFSGLRVANRVE